MGSHLHFLAGILHLQSAYCLYALAACTHFSNSATTAQSRLLLFLLNWMADSGSWWSPSGCFCCSVLSSDRSLSFRRRRCSLPYSGLSDAYETKREQDILIHCFHRVFLFRFLDDVAPCHTVGWATPTRRKENTISWILFCQPYSWIVPWCLPLDVIWTALQRRGKHHHMRQPCGTLGLQRGVFFRNLQVVLQRKGLNCLTIDLKFSSAFAPLSALPKGCFDPVPGSGFKEHLVVTLNPATHS